MCRGSTTSSQYYFALCWQVTCTPDHSVCFGAGTGHGRTHRGTAVLAPARLVRSGRTPPQRTTLRRPSTAVGRCCHTRMTALRRPPSACPAQVFHPLPWPQHSTAAMCKFSQDAVTRHRRYASTTVHGCLPEIPSRTCIRGIEEASTCEPYVTPTRMACVGRDCLQLLCDDPIT